MSVLKHIKEVTPAEEFETTRKEYLEENGISKNFQKNKYDLKISNIIKKAIKEAKAGRISELTNDLLANEKD